MKKVLSLILALVMAASLGLPAFADDEVAAEESYNTQVEYVGKGEEAYTLTVPAELVPTEGQNSGDVILSGTWNSTRQITVSADTKVTLSTKFGDSKELAVTFAGIVLPGSNTEAVSKTEPVSVETMTALFGDWSGTFYYNVEAGDIVSGDVNNPGTDGDGEKNDTDIDGGDDNNEDVATYDATFANNSWEKIATACQNNEVPETWNVGDTKNMTIDGVEYPIAIIDKNHDTYSDDNETAPLTFGLTKGLNFSAKLGKSYPWSWSSSDMRNTTLANVLPTMEANEKIRAVNKESSVDYTAETTITADKLFLFSEYEVSGVTTYSAAEEGTHYPYFADAGHRRISNADSSNYWWLRSCTAGDSDKYQCCGVSGSGTVHQQNYIGNEHGIVFGFCF